MQYRFSVNFGTFSRELIYIEREYVYCMRKKEGWNCKEREIKKNWDREGGKKIGKRKIYLPIILERERE